MANELESRATIVLFGLSQTLLESLEDVLTREGHTVYSLSYISTASCLSIIEQVNAELVFCAAGAEHHCPLLEAIKKSKPELPVIIVSRLPEVAEWLESLESGASDYCAPPFEPTQIRWILESALKSCHVAA